MTEITQDDTFALDIDGHKFVFRKLPLQQLTIWRMYITRWQKQFAVLKDAKKRQDAVDVLVSNALDVAEERLVSDDDRQLLISKLLANKFEYMELFGVFRNGAAVDTAADDDDVKPVKKAAAPRKPRVKR